MHEPVLMAQVLEWLQVKAGGVYVDGTLGGGGHAAAIARVVGPAGTLVGLDRDADALRAAGAALQGSGAKVILAQGNYAEMNTVLDRNGVGEVDGILLDLGISSNQLDAPERGFSFSADGPLDMRMDRTAGETAADLVNRLDERSLAELIRAYGEDPSAGRQARAIVAARRARPIATTHELARLAEQCAHGRRGAIHPATRLFQALRIAVNRELDHIEPALEAGLGRLRPGGRMAVISFHSLEDRIVKHTFRAHEGRWVSLQEGGRRWEGRLPRVLSLFRKPIEADEAERRRNPRARSARLRVVERV